MQNNIVAVFAVAAVVLMMTAPSTASLHPFVPDLYTRISHDTTGGLLLAHHVGNTPSWVGPDDTEEWNVHGGDWNPDWDPNLDNPSMEPDNRPDTNPRPDDSGPNE